MIIIFISGKTTMYALIDRPVTQLDGGSRFLLWAMRGWIDSVTRRRCPPGALGPAFAKMSALEALPHFHIFMAGLNRHALEKLQLEPMDHPLIGEHEAILLSLWHDAAQDQPMHAKAILALLLAEEAVSVAAQALRQTVGHLAQAELLPRLTN